MASNKTASNSKTSGSQFRNKMARIKKGRNWTEQEQELFCQILADPERCFAVTLETKALKKNSNKEVLDSIHIIVAICTGIADLIHFLQQFIEVFVFPPFPFPSHVLHHSYTT